MDYWGGGGGGAKGMLALPPPKLLGGGPGPPVPMPMGHISYFSSYNSCCHNYWYLNLNFQGAKNYFEVPPALDISKVKVNPKLLISHSKFSGPRKFTLRYQ